MGMRLRLLFFSSLGSPALRMVGAPRHSPDSPSPTDKQEEDYCHQEFKGLPGGGKKAGDEELVFQFRLPLILNPALL